MVDKTLTQVRTDNPAAAPTGAEPIETVQSATSAAFTFSELENSPLNAQTGTTYTLAITDQKKTVTMNNASANTLTIPLNATVAFHIGAKLLVRQIGAGGTTIAATGGVTIELDANASLVMDGAQQQILLHKTATDAWHAAPVATGSGGGAGPSAAKVSLSSTLTGRGDSTTDIVFDTEDYDDNAYHSGTSAKLTVPSGVTRVNLNANVFFSSVTVSVRSFILISRYNSSDVFQEVVAESACTTPNSTYGLSASVLGAECVAGDYFVARSRAVDASHSVNTGTTFTIQDVSP